MKKIMWLCNTPLPEMQKESGKRVCSEGWLQGISDQLRKRKDIELHYVFPQGKRLGLFQKQVNNITFWGFYSNIKNGYELSQERKRLISRIIKEIHPDIIHIFGTEFAHALECVQVLPNGTKVVVSVQGLISELARVCLKKISIIDWAFCMDCSGNLLEKKYGFYRRGINEKKILKAVPNVIGRTKWDKRCVKKINPNSRYYYCSETLRTAFYEGCWSLDNVKRHTIYISQADYSIKGFHIFIEALHKVRQRFPDTCVYVAGDRLFLEQEDAYGKYISKLLDKYKVRSSIRFLGILSAEKVKERLLKAHVTVMPSLLENSPNSIGEAMQLGTPVVAAQVGGIPSLVRNGKEALLYSGHSAGNLAACIRAVFDSDELAEKLSNNGRKRAAKLYDRNANLKQLLEIYNAMGEGGI